MAMTISGTGGITFPDASTQASGQQVCKAWVRFNGSTSTIASSYNVSSITKSTTGTYLLNFSVALSDTNYSVIGSSGQGGSNNYQLSTNYASAPTTTQCSVGACNGNASSMVDAAYVSVACYR